VPTDSWQGGFDARTIYSIYWNKSYMADYLGSFDLFVLLALLRLEEENAYGVTISTEIHQTTGRTVALATIYATLERLEDRGLVSSRLGESTAQRGGRAKRHFRVTTNGVRQVRQAKGALVKMWRGIRELQEA
jgi:DNA-binding PadR family transcriptional regulator